MAIADVEFNFLCADRSLRYTHPLPATLVHTGGDPRSDAAYQQQLWNSTSTILASYGDECFEHSTKICVNCNGAAVTPLMTANYYLHLSPPRIFVNVNPACNSKACEREIRLGMQSTLAAAANFPLVGAAPNGPLQDTPPLEVLPCPVCHKTEGVRKCTGCGVVAYCSEDHQRAHWKYHKKMCVKTKSRQSS